jgi:hypothetical protein
MNVTVRGLGGCVFLKGSNSGLGYARLPHEIMASDATEVAFAIGSRKIHLPGSCARNLRFTGRVPAIQKINLPAAAGKCGLRRITRHDFVWV